MSAMVKAKERRLLHRRLFVAAAAAWAALPLEAPLSELAWAVLGLILLVAYMAGDDAHATAEPLWLDREMRVEDLRRTRQEESCVAGLKPQAAHAQRARIAAARQAGCEVFVVLTPDGDYVEARSPDGSARRL